MMWDKQDLEVTLGGVGESSFERMKKGGGGLASRRHGFLRKTLMAKRLR